VRKHISLKASPVVLTLLASICLSAFPASASPVPAPTTNWGGFYIGAHLGGNAAHFIADPVILAAENTAANVTAGGHVGFNFQSGAHVFGVEADGSWIGITAEAPTASFDEDWQTTFRGRYGYAIDRFLPYITAGVALTGTTASVTGSGSQDKTVLGYAAGAGVDIALCDRVSGRIEFLLTGVPRTNYLVGATPVIGESNNEALRIGLNYSLGNL
jgi:outer membrane immunogenic protein